MCGTLIWQLQRKYMFGNNWQDIKHLYDAGCDFEIMGDLAEDADASLFVGDENEDWIQFERVLDMSEQEFNEEIERKNGGV